MKQYLNIMEDIINNGVNRKGCNGLTRSMFAVQMRFDLSKGFPAVTTKKLDFKLVLSELLWFIEGSGDERRLREILYESRDEFKSTIWTDNASADYLVDRWLTSFKSDTGRIYVVQWRSWANKDGEVFDQLANVIEKIKSDPYDRRLIVSAWNPCELHKMAFPPCHLSFQFYVANKKISLHMNQRSCDMFLGVPFNIASYSILLTMVAQVVGLEPGEVVFTLNDAHIYGDHFGAVRKQLARIPCKLPTLWINPDITEIDKFTMDDIKLVDYNHEESIKAPTACLVE